VAKALTFSFLLLPLFALSAVAQTPPPAPTQTEESSQRAKSVADPSVQSAVVVSVENNRKRFGGHEPVPATLIGIWDNKGGSFIRAFGYADLEKKVPLTPADHFRIGSNTKTFVVSVLLQLVAEKKLSLDDPLSRFSLGVAIPNAENIYRARALRDAQWSLRRL
jgi:CubicO group peptidase (beta-lactamase class C family)